MACIAVDLDGTLAEWEDGQEISIIGKPIPLMIERVKKWLAQGIEVRIFTARASNGALAVKHVKAWLKVAGLPDLKVTNEKTWDIVEYWDDRAVSVQHNTGRVLTQGR